MSDRPQPGKDKDLRFIRQAIDHSQEVYSLLSEEVAKDGVPGIVELNSEALLLAIDQYDILCQMTDNPTMTADQVIEHNRCLRDLLKLLIKERLAPTSRIATVKIIQILGAQLQTLMVTKEIRGAQ